MARDWNLEVVTLHRWLRSLRIPESTEYALLAEKLGLSIEEVWRLCQEERRLRQLVAS